MKTLLLALIGAWGLGIPVVWSCSCAPLDPPLKALAKVEAVFSGEVLATEELRRDDVTRESLNDLSVTVAVTKSWKGDVTGTVTVRTKIGGTACGFPFEKGRSYLIYAYQPESGPLRTSRCMRTKKLKRAATEILELEGKLPKPLDPPAPPVLVLAGKFRKDGEEGFSFNIENKLHDRIFLFWRCLDAQLIQVLEDNRWVDYVPNTGYKPRDELSAADAAKAFGEWKQKYGALKASDAASFLDRLAKSKTFVAAPTATKTWRVGMQYVTEAELDSGKAIQSSKHYVWSEPVIPTRLNIPELSYDQVFVDELE